MHGGVLRKGTKITFGASDSQYEVAEVGYNQLPQVETDALGPAQVAEAATLAAREAAASAISRGLRLNCIS